MPKDPLVAIRDCLSEIAILQEIAARMTLDVFRRTRLRAAPPPTRSKPSRKLSAGFLTLGLLSIPASRGRKSRRSGTGFATNNTGSMMPFYGRS
jgi:hypothetical protein